MITKLLFALLEHKRKFNYTNHLDYLNYHSVHYSLLEAEISCARGSSISFHLSSELFVLTDILFANRTGHSDDHSTIALHPDKMEELKLFIRDIVLLKGKKRKSTIAVVVADENVDVSKVQMTKVFRSNLR
jgi:hypothetical protein